MNHRHFDQYLKREKERRKSRMQLEFNDGIALLKFNHPEVMNAIGATMLKDFADALADIKSPANGARCILLTGEGAWFLCWS